VSPRFVDRQLSFTAVLVEQSLRPGLYPILRLGTVRIDRRRAFPQNYDIGDDFGPGVLFKGAARQSNGGQEFRMHSEVTAHHIFTFIQRIARGDEGENPAGFKEREAFDEKIIVHALTQAAIPGPRIVTRHVGFCGMTSV
jgi:hypothetical protein